MHCTRLKKTPYSKATLLTPILVLMAASGALADTKRQLATHEHGVSLLNIAFEGTAVHMELYAPGVDIVGFEHPAVSEADKEKVNAALAMLTNPLKLFVLEGAAGCAIKSSQVRKDRDGADEKNSYDWSTKEAAAGHGDGKDEQYNHEHHVSEGDDHQEFNAEYLWNCQKPDELNEIKFAYFGEFPNAQKIKVQLVETAGAKTFEVGRASPVLDLGR